MKKTLFVLILTLTFVKVSAQRPSGNSAMIFDRVEHDFGRIDEAQGVVECRFSFSNTGSVPIVIDAISVSCGCTTPAYPKAPVMPGKSAEIKVKFDPKDRPGRFKKEIYVVTNNRKNVNELTIKGNVIPKPPTVNEEYPFELTSGVRLTKQQINFSYVAHGELKSQIIGVVNTSKREVSLYVKPAVPSDYFLCSVPNKLCAGCKADITMTYNISSKSDIYGLQTSDVVVYVNSKPISIPIKATAIVTDYFPRDNGAKSPKALFSTTSINFGDVSSTDKLTRDIVLDNDGDSPLIIRSVKCDTGFATTLKEGSVIKEGEKTTFRVEILSTTPAGSAGGSIRVVTNDPHRPYREIRLFANIK